MTRSPTRRWLFLVLAAGMLAVLIAIRPALPGSSGLSAPLATDDLAHVAVFALWGVAIAAILGVALRAITSPPPRRSISGRTTVVNAGPRRSRAPRSVIGTRLPVIEPYLRVTAARSPATATDSPAASTPSSNEGGGSDEVPQIRISLLGPFQLDAPSGKRIKRTATRDLIAYLALHPHGATRDELLEALWPGGDPRRTQPRLWQSITEARKLLGKALRRHGERYALDRALISVDVDMVDERVRDTEPGTPIAAEEAHDIGLLVRGPPLSDVDATWVDSHKRRLVATSIELLTGIAQTSLVDRNPGRALDAAERGLLLDNLNETLWQMAMRAHADLGARAAVTISYQQLAALLERELAVTPSRQTRTLYRQLLAQDA